MSVARRRLIALALGLFGSALVGEVLVRLTLGAPLPERRPILEVRAHATRGWEMLPSTTHYTYHHPVRVNALGLRGPEVAPKAEGERRVLALGDSLIYGQGVAEEDTLPAHLERALGPGWTVVNAGLRAYDTRQELALLDELGERIDPDVVVLFWYRNDFVERDIEGTNERLTASGPIAFDVGSPLEGAALFEWRTKELVRRSALAMFVYDLVKSEQVDLVADATPAGLERLEGYVARFRERCGELGAQPLFCVIPMPSHATGKVSERDPDPRALALARAAGVPGCDLYDALAGLEVVPTVPFDGHYASGANAAMARTVAELVRDSVSEE